MIQKLSNQAGKTQYTINAVTGCGEVNRGLATKSTNVS